MRYQSSLTFVRKANTVYVFPNMSKYSLKTTSWCLSLDSEAGIGIDIKSIKAIVPTLVCVRLFWRQSCSTPSYFFTRLSQPWSEAGVALS